MLVQKDQFMSEQLAHEKAMAEGNSKFLAALQGEPAGTKLIWRGNRMPLIKGETIRRQTDTASQHQERKAFIESLRVENRVCLRCGANQAKGCSHVS